MSKPDVHVVGSGLAGSEAAYSLARHGLKVALHEMRPTVMTPAHRSGKSGELVCSNSLKSTQPISGPGILKAEMKAMDSLVLRAAEHAQIPAGDALGVDREVFADFITDVLDRHANITRVSGEVLVPPTDAPTLLATGPLTSDKLCEWLARATGAEDLYFYDAIAPIIDASSIDMDFAFIANRYDKGGEDAYINCPMNEDQYTAFIAALLSAETIPSRNFEKEKFFQGCQPIEAIAAGGMESLRFGPMKPVGLTDPRTGKRPHAVVQLRPENHSKTAYNMVGFQTKLKYGEQKRVLGNIPALRNAEYLRLGSMHRNTYVCGPRVLRPDLSLKGNPNIYLAGQITGVEGYVESSACGLIAAEFIRQRLKGERHAPPPPTSGMGALLRHIIAGNADDYQPANIHFGLFEQNLFDGLTGLKKDKVRESIASQAFRDFGTWMGSRSR